jgi:DnaJ-class molecular chaperone
VSSDEGRFRDGETLNQIDGVGSWAGQGVEGSAAVFRDETLCWSCGGDGTVLLEGGFYEARCPVCRGTGWVDVDHGEWPEGEDDER